MSLVYIIIFNDEWLIDYIQSMQQLFKKKKIGTINLIYFLKIFDLQICEDKNDIGNITLKLYGNLKLQIT